MLMFLGLNLMSHFNYENITTYTQRTATDLKVGHFISFTPIISTCAEIAKWVILYCTACTFSSNKINTADLHDMFLNKGWLKIQSFSRIKWIKGEQARKLVMMMMTFCPQTCSDDVRLHVFSLLNPSSPNSDQHQFSPNNTHTMSRD